MWSCTLNTTIVSCVTDRLCTIGSTHIPMQVRVRFYAYAITTRCSVALMWRVVIAFDLLLPCCTSPDCHMHYPMYMLYGRCSVMYAIVLMSFARTVLQAAVHQEFIIIDSIGVFSWETEKRVYFPDGVVEIAQEPFVVQYRRYKMSNLVCRL